MAKKLTTDQKRMIQLAEDLENMRSLAKERQEELNQLMSVYPTDVIFVDDAGIGWRVAKAKGTFVEFYDRTMQHSRREGETQGTISVKDMKDAGFDVK